MWAAVIRDDDRVRRTGEVGGEHVVYRLESENPRNLIDSKVPASGIPMPPCRTNRSTSRGEDRLPEPWRLEGTEDRDDGRSRERCKMHRCRVIPHDECHPPER